MRTEVYKRADGLWAWRVVAENGNIVATDGGQGYENRADCEHMAALFTVTPEHDGVTIIRPGDVAVLHYSVPITREDAETIKRKWAETAPGTDVIVLTEHVQLVGVVTSAAQDG